MQSPQQSSGQQIIQLQQAQQSPTSQTGGLQIIQQVVAPSGEVQNIPVSNEVCSSIPVGKKKKNFRRILLMFVPMFHIIFFFSSDSADSPAIADDSYASTRREQSTDYNTDCSNSDSTTTHPGCTRRASSSFHSNHQCRYRIIFIIMFALEYNIHF